MKIHINMVIGFVFLFFLSFYSYVQSCNNYRKPDRIVGGFPADVTQFPYQLALESINGMQVCGASVIHELWAITAAHCVYNSQPSLLLIRSGSSYKETDGTLHGVENIIIHPYFNMDNFDHDVAIIKVSNPFEYSDVCGPIAMATETPPADTPAVVSGWGNLIYQGPTAYQLQQVTVYIMDYWTCKETYHEQLTEAMVCAVYPYGGKDACNGDSGGPLVANGELVGVVSWGIGCGNPYYPGVYVDVAKIQSWVTSTIQEN